MPFNKDIQVALRLSHLNTNTTRYYNATEGQVHTFDQILLVKNCYIIKDYFCLDKDLQKFVPCKIPKIIVDGGMSVGKSLEG